ncbi:hypothetical protein SeMB42_g06221 [Synchytrium endobioticum]|uniref:mRNA guanylyltransferase n=1 Tax=Synchytrium endobioticum TaxID=286115 RepID=A0A507CEA6_9FUNG|nr:hypothetical protein SeMB42_g06221 [Synchytrium endobioticum]
MLPQIPGNLLPDKDDHLAQLRKQVGALFGVSGSRFPGAQPVSFAKQHLAELEHENYFVSEKADGIRCLMYTTTSLAGNKVWTFLIDRKNSYYFQPNLWLPFHADLRKPQVETLLDGELVLDAYPDGREELLFYLFDCIVHYGKNLADRPYTTRLGYMRDWILKPYNKLRECDSAYVTSQPFKIVEKPLQLAYHVRKVFQDLPQLRHQSDGVIFTSSVAPYAPGTCGKMVKWKPVDENTVDFRIVNDVDDDGGLVVHLDIFCGDSRFERVGQLTLDEEERDIWRQNPPCDGSIAECRYDPSAETEWRFSRWRNDKVEANHISTFKKIMESIQDAVGKEDLLAHSLNIQKAWYIREGKPLPSIGAAQQTDDASSSHHSDGQTQNSSNINGEDFPHGIKRSRSDDDASCWSKHPKVS